MSGSIAKYFKSPKGDDSQETKKAEEKDDGLGESCSSSGCSLTTVEGDGGATPVAAAGGGSGCGAAIKIDSMSDENRKIAKTMASVLKSMKKKHHKSSCKKRKRNGDHKEKDCQPEAAEEDIEVVEEEAAKEPPRRSPRKSCQQQKDDEKPSTSSEQSKKVNAFALMMSSRNKSIGSNSPGKDSSAALDPEEEQRREDKVKRKLKLEEWAEKKGGGKRKLQEAAEEEFITHQMNRRAKRLKKLIKNMEVPEDDEDGEEDEVVEVKKSPRKSNRQTEAEQKSAPSEAQEVPKLSEKRGRRRLSSDDSEPLPVEVKAETIEKSPEKKSEGSEFVSKLNSPLKKKDSLLGYFNKVDKSPDAVPVEEKPPVVPQRTRGRPRNPRKSDLKPVEDERMEVEVAEVPQQDENESPLEVTSTSGRPRRSCVGKIKDYAVFSGTSPEKESCTRRTGKKPIVTPLKIVNVGSPQTMKVVKSPSLRQLGAEVVSNKNVKLAPLFVKKPVEDPEKTRARQEFLMSGIPEKMRLEIEKQRSYEESILDESPVFPLVSHVQQLPVVPSKIDRSPFRKSKIRIKPVTPEKAAAPVERDEEFEFGTLNYCDDDVVEDILTKLVGFGESGMSYSYNLPRIINVKDIVREWKQIYKHFPVFKCYKQFRAMFEEQEDPPFRVGRAAQEDIVLENSLEIVEPKLSFQNGEILFTEKYKPTLPDHILVNCKPAATLMKFLSSWKEDRSSNPYDSEDDFESSNSSMSSSSNQTINHVVLVGPPGSGKTSSVYAVANEMNFNVLELNASSRRKGKIILQELQEATQSHQVRRKDESLDIFKKSLGRKNGKIEPRTLSFDSDSNSAAAGSKKLSLILIEDADIVFDQDEGFVAAINQLIASSKRPIVLTTTNRNSAHLARYIANNVIRYVAPGIAEIAKLLSIMALVEKVHIDQSDLARLYALNRKDLRKTINELQFFIQSGGDRGRDRDPAALLEEPKLRLREEKPSSQPLYVDETSHLSNASSSHSESSAASAKPPTLKHRSLYRLFSRNQNQLQLIRAPINFDNLWCNMERVLRTQRPSQASAPTPTESKKSKKGPPKPPTKTDQEQAELEELVFFYGNVSAAARIQRNSQGGLDDRLVNHLEEEMAHELVEYSWERWFEGEPDQQVETEAEKETDRRRSGVGAMCYDSLTQFDSEERQTISTYIGINPIRTRSTYCDYEPFLRTICRYERERSRSERRGSRFYHYFRHFANSNGNSTTGTNAGMPLVSNFSVDHFDDMSTRFEELPPTTTTTGTKQKVAIAESSDESR